MLLIRRLIRGKWLSLMDNFYTYAYLREDRTPYYIGKGKNNRAYFTYNRNIQVPKDKDRILFLKQNLTEEDAFKHEKYMIAILGRMDLGTGILRNLTEGGEGTSGVVRSEETRKKMSDGQLGEKNHNYGKPRSEETRKKISESTQGEKHYNYGKVLSEETRKKLSELNTGKSHPMYGKTLSKDHRKKISNSNKGKSFSEESKRKMSDAKKGKKSTFFGKTHSEETRRKISETLKAINK